MAPKLFGTDGIRGKPGTEPLTPETLERLGRILADRIAGLGDGRPTFVLGHDGRESGESLAASLSEGLVRGGVQVDILGLAPTPVVAYLTGAGGYAGGAVVSASHNPAEDNGIKLLGRDGSKLADEDEAALEADLVSGRELANAKQPGEMRRAKNKVADYVIWLRNDAFPELDLSGWTVVMDCANGAYSELGPRVLRAFGAHAEALNHKPDGHNINADCGSLHPENAIQAVRATEADVGLVVDGDGDRGLLIDSAGRLLDGDALLAGLGEQLARRNLLPKNALVATVMSNMGLERYLADCGVEVRRVAVGDRNVVAAMRQEGLALGGEKSGHLLFGEEHGYRGDGVYTFLKTAEAMRVAGIGSQEFAAEFHEFPQKLVGLRVHRRAPLAELPHLSAAVREVDASLGDQGRSVVRFSGTELVLRLMVEAQDAETIEAALDRLERAAREDGLLSA